MSQLKLTLLLVCGLFVARVGVAAETAEVKTLMTTRGKLVYSDSFAEPLGKEWKVAKGDWKVVDGALAVRELKADMHGAAARRALPATNFVAQYSFKLDGAKGTTFSINCTKGHCSRVLITPSALVVRKDSHDHNKTDKPATLDQQTVQVTPGEWHTLVIEVLGPQILASLDGKTVAFGSQDSIGHEKSNIGLTVAGESVSFKDFKLWEAEPNSEWKANQARLSQGRAPAKAK